MEHRRVAKGSVSVYGKSESLENTDLSLPSSRFLPLVQDGERPSWLRHCGSYALSSPRGRNKGNTKEHQGRAKNMRPLVYCEAKCNECVIRGETLRNVKERLIVWASSVLGRVFMFILLIVCRFSTASETHVRIEIV